MTDYGETSTIPNLQTILFVEGGHGKRAEIGAWGRPFVIPYVGEFPEASKQSGRGTFGQQHLFAAANDCG